MVRVIASHLANCEVNSSYCNCKVVKHEEDAKQFFFPKESFIHSHFLFPHYHPLHTIIKRNTVDTQNNIAKCKKNLSIFLKGTFACGGLKSLLRLAYFLRTEFKTTI